MKKILYFAVVLSLGSCASILNQPTEHITIITSKPAKIIYRKEIFNIREDEAHLKVIRENKPVEITLKGDSLTKTVICMPHNSFAYWLNAYPPMWPGFWIDKDNPKGYAYPRLIYINMKDTANQYYLYDTRDRKGQLYFHISLPYINNFVLQPTNQAYKNNTGWIGLGLGLDYYYKSRQYISLFASAVTDVPAPMGPIDYFGSYETMSSMFIGLSNNYKINNLMLGYGLSLSRNTWVYNYIPDEYEVEPNSKSIFNTNYALGFIFPMYYQFDKSFFAGVIYRPTFYRFSESNPFKYEHLISIDFGWKLRIK